MTSENLPQLLNPVENTVRLLDKVRREAKRAEKNRDAEHVHDVRVAIRRARQALAEFRPVLPGRTARKARRKLHKILDKAAPIRDIDIAFELLKTTHVRPGRALTRALCAERARLEKNFHEALVKFQERDSVKKWTSKIHVPASDEAPSGAGELPKLAAEYFQEGDRIADPATHVEDLHKFRLKTKQFRYTLELYADSYGAELKARLKGLRNVQQHLGTISDCVSTMELLKRWRETDAAAVDQAVESIRPLIEKHARAFRQNWRDSFNNSEQRNWIRLLQRGGSASPARRPPARATNPRNMAAKTA